MKTIEIKFELGDLVTHFTGITGMVTAIFHRSGRNSYEFSFLKDDSPSCIAVEEHEIHISPHGSLGFKRKE